MREAPSDLIALKLWWAMMWRTLPLAMLAGFLAGLVIGFVMGLMGGTPEDVQMPATLAGGLLGIYVSVRVIRHLMTRGFGKYKLVVVSNDA